MTLRIIYGCDGCPLFRVNHDVDDEGPGEGECSLDHEGRKGKTHYARGDERFEMPSTCPLLVEDYVLRAADFAGEEEA